MKTIHNILWRIHTKYKHMWRRTCIQMPNVKLCSYALQSVTDEVETAASLNQSPCSPGGWACQVYSHRSQSSQSNTSKHATIVAVLTSLINTGVCVCVCVCVCREGVTWTSHMLYAVRRVLFEVLMTSASQHIAAEESADTSSHWPGEVLHICIYNMVWF